MTQCQEAQAAPWLDRSLQLQTRTAVLVCDGAVGGMRIVRANPAFASMVGITVDEAIGRTLLSFAGPLTDLGIIANGQEKLRRGEGFVSEFAIHRPDGTGLWVETDFAPLGDSGQFAVIARDVTQRIERDAELQRAKAQLDLATAAGRVGIWEWNPRTGEAFWTDTLRELVGLPADYEVGLTTWLDITHPDDRVLAQAAIEAGWRRGESQQRIVRPIDGRVIHVVVRSTGDGADRLIGTVVDITDVQEASERVRATLESMPDAHYAVDREWRLIYVNRRTEAAVGRSRYELLGTCLWDHFRATEGTPFETHLRAAMDERRPVEFEAYYPEARSWFELRAYPTPDGGLGVHFRDVGERRAAEAERERLLTRDPLTDLANRTQFVEHLDAAIAAGRQVSVLFVDLDRFKLVNDSLGHAAGDALLKAVARRLDGLVRDGDVVARIGGDEFVVGVVDANRGVVEAVAGRMLDAIRAPVEIDGQLLVVSASIGIAEAARDADAETLLRDADVALYRAKDAGRDQTIRFDAQARQDVLDRVRIEADLRSALAEGQLVLHHQPLFDLQTGALLGTEALLWWTHPVRGPISPCDFIPVAEESGLILPIGEWVLEQTVRAAVAHDAPAPLTAWANVSARQLAHPGLAATIARLLHESGLPAGRLGVEITESVLGDSRRVRSELEAISALGVQVAIDDFGTGFSSIARLRDLPVDVLKIDRSFVAAMDDAGGRETVAAIVHLGHAFGRAVLAEGVETAEQLAALRRVGCDRVSGFLLARPVPAAEVPAAAERGSALLVP